MDGHTAQIEGLKQLDNSEYKLFVGGRTNWGKRWLMNAQLVQAVYGGESVLIRKGNQSIGIIPHGDYVEIKITEHKGKAL